MTVSSQIIEVIDNLAQKFGVAIDWSQQNVMPYLQELCGKYITWEISSSFVWIAIGAAIGIVGLLIAIFCDWDDIEKIIGVILGVVGLAVIGTQVFDIVRCNTFPELQVFNYVKSLISAGASR